MQKIEVYLENVIKTYNAGCPDVKKVLENLFGKNNFVPQNIMDRVTSFEEACKITGDIPGNAKFVSGSAHIIAAEKLEVICKALCEGVKLTYRNGNQKKWYPVMIWDESASGFRFYDALYDFSAALACLGSRLQVDTEAKAKYLGTHPEFVKLLNDLQINHEHETIR